MSYRPGLQLLSNIDYILELKQKNISKNDMEGKLKSLDIDCEIKSETDLSSGNQTSNLYIKVGIVQAEFKPEYIKYIFDNKENFSYLCGYIERRSKERNQIKKLEKLLAA